MLQEAQYVFVRLRLKNLRQNSCYKTLRAILEAGFALSLFLIFASTIVLVPSFAILEDGISIVRILWILSTSIILVIIAIAIRQLFLLLIDIADTLLYEHSSSK